MDTRKSEKLVAVIVSIGLAVYCVKKAIDTKQKSVSKYDVIPVPRGGYFYLGHLPFLMSKPGAQVKAWHKKYGPLINVKTGVQNWVFIGDRRIAHEIFVSQGISSSGRAHYTYGFNVMGRNGSGLTFNDYGKDWKNSRKAALHLLSPSTVGDMRDLLLDEAERCADLQINETMERGRVEDPGEYIMMSTINVILRTLFNKPPLQNRDDPLFIELEDILIKSVEFVGPLKDPASFFPIMSSLEGLFGFERNLHNFWDKRVIPLFDEMIEKARKNDYDCLTKEIYQKKEELGFNEYDVKLSLIELFLAGATAPSVVMLWTYLLLCQYPESQRRIAQEIDSFVEKHQRFPTFEDRSNFPYYNSFQKEVLRFRSPTQFGIPHKANDDIIYKNYFIPKGTILASTMFVIHFDPNDYEEPEKFIPERFLNEQRSISALSRRPIEEKCEFSFGWGRRMCPGIAMSEQIMFSNIIQLLSKCTIEPALSATGEKIYPNTEDLIELGMVTRPKVCNLRFVPRKR